jgi:hypothetical protein
MTKTPQTLFQLISTQTAAVNEGLSAGFSMGTRDVGGMISLTYCLQMTLQFLVRLTQIIHIICVVLKF